MFFSFNLIETIPLQIVNILFFLAFFSILILSYPAGRYFLNNYSENNLIKCSIFSIAIFSAVVSIAVNLAPIFAKYIIFTFYLINLYILFVNLRIRNDLIKAIIPIKFILIFIFFLFLIINEVFKIIHINKDELIYIYNSHNNYFLDPILEIISANYFSRLKIFSIYPFEWSTYHFFESSFNSFFLLPIYKSGTIGLIALKNFQLSIFIILFYISFFDSINLKKGDYSRIIFKLLLVSTIFIFLFYPKVIYFILTKNFVSTISLIFIVQSILNKNKNDLLIWLVILSMAAFRNLFITFMFMLYYLIDNQNLSFSNIILKIKKIFNKPILLLLTLLIIYFLVTIFSGIDTSQKFHLLDNKYPWWRNSISKNIILNYKYFIFILFTLIIFYLLLSKYFLKKKIRNFLSFNKYDYYFLCLILVIPSSCILILLFKTQILNTFESNILVLFFKNFTLQNLYYYFFVPVVWCVLLFILDNLLRYIFALTVIIYTFLSIFISNNIILPGFFALEIMMLFIISLSLVKDDFFNDKKIFTHLFIFSFSILCLFDSNYFTEPRKDYTRGSKYFFNITDIKKLSKKNYICLADIQQVRYKYIDHISSEKLLGSAVSSIIAKPYYPNISSIEKYSEWGIVHSRFAVPPSMDSVNPCLD